MSERAYAEGTFRCDRCLDTGTVWSSVVAERITCPACAYEPAPAPESPRVQVQLHKMAADWVEREPHCAKDNYDPLEDHGHPCGCGQIESLETLLLIAFRAGELEAEKRGYAAGLADEAQRYQAIRDWLAEEAAEPCAYGCNCPAFHGTGDGCGSRHYRCRSCKAKELLRALIPSEPGRKP